eukprot:1962528-Prymnesium_polylepis.1
MPRAARAVRAHAAAPPPRPPPPQRNLASTPASAHPYRRTRVGAPVSAHLPAARAMRQRQGRSAAEGCGGV